jgi:tagatose-1,6-bisphosphate aldolase non-catalytic subunit AgaZ/GatZ
MKRSDYYLRIDSSVSCAGTALALAKTVIAMSRAHVQHISMTE